MFIHNETQGPGQPCSENFSCRQASTALEKVGNCVFFVVDYQAVVSVKSDCNFYLLPK